MQLRSLIPLLIRPKSLPKHRERKAHLRLLNLEDRAVPAEATAVFTGGILTITGATAPHDVNDDLSVDLVAGRIAVFVNGTTPVTITDGANPVAPFTQRFMSGIVVNAGDGHDTIFISSSIIRPATLNGGFGDDNLTGGSGADQINGNDGVDFLFGMRGNDTINGGDGDGQVIDGGDGNDLMTGGVDTDDMFGGKGNDTINGGAGDDRIRGDAANDRRGGNDIINGEDGDDIIVAGRGNDILSGGSGNDVIEAGDGNDIVVAGPDDDAGPDFNADADSVYGGNGNDAINGGWGRDLLYGEAGNDSLIGGAGEDNLSGGLGTDQFVGHGNPTGANVGEPKDLENFDTYRDEFNLTRPIHLRAEPKDIAITELGIQAALAGVASVANNQSGYNISGRIRYLGSGEYLVKLGPDDDISPASSGNPNPFGWVPVHFDGTWTDNDPLPSAQQRFNVRRNAPEFWTILLHRAIVHNLTGTYDPLVHYTQTDYELLNPALTNAADVIEALTGFPPTPVTYSFIDLRNELKVGFWFTAQANGTPIAGVAPNQFYAITKVLTIRGTNYITLYNPSAFDRGATPTGALDQFGRPIDDGFITLTESDFLASFGTLFRN